MNGAMTLAAAAPILLVLGLLVMRVGSLKAAAAGLGAALAAASLAFPVEARDFGAAASQHAPTIVTVALILLGGVGLAEAMARTGARAQIAAWLGRVEPGPDRSLTLLMLAFGVTPFMESVTGFGLGVAITAPLLIATGLTPVRAVVTGLLGLVLVPWGSLAPGTLVAAELGGESFHALGVWSAVLSLPVILVAVAGVLILLAGRPRGTHLALGALIVAVMWGTLVGASLALSPPLAGVLAAAAVIGATLLIARVRHGRLPGPGRELPRAVAPYLLLTGGILAGYLAVALGGEAFVWAKNPALWLIVAALAALAPLRGAGGFSRAAHAAVLTWVPIAATTIAFILIGVVMATTGMAAHLASAGAGLGPLFTAAIPFFGALGGYLTGSNTGAAAMFSAATSTVAGAVGASSLLALAGQNVAGSFAIIASPPRIALAVGVAMGPQAELPPRAEMVLAAAVAGATTLLGIALLALA